MKGRLRSAVWSLIGINAVVLVAVLGLAYGAGARSGGLGLRDFGALPQVAGFEFLGAIFLILVISLVLFIQLGSKVLKPAADLVEFSEKLLGGDYGLRADIRPDDFGIIAENFNRAAEVLGRSAELELSAENLRAQMAEIGDAAAQMARGDLTVRVKPSLAMLAPIADAINSLAENFARKLERVRASTTEVAAAGNQAMAAVAEVAGGATQQEQDATAATGRLEQLTAAARNLSAQSNEAADAAQRALGIAEQGGRALHDAGEGMQRVRATLQSTGEKIKTLAERSLEIYDVVNVIHETNLLALDAVVESSRGSETGRAAEVLSGELRKLSEHSRAATRDIVALLKAIQKESNEAAAFMEEANRVAETGTRLTDQASKSLAGITAALRQNVELSQALATAVQQQAQASVEMGNAVQATFTSTRSLAGVGRQAAKLVDQLVRAAEQLNQSLTRPAAVAAPKAEIAAVARA